MKSRDGFSSAVSHGLVQQVFAGLVNGAKWFQRPQRGGFEFLAAFERPGRTVPGP